LPIILLDFCFQIINLVGIFYALHKAILIQDSNDEDA